MEVKDLICIGCPIGCVLKVMMQGKEVIKIEGNTCKRGEIYGKKEVTNPTRIVTTTVRVKDGSIPMVSVKTKTDIPKKLIFTCIRELKEIEVQAPIHIGDIIKENIAGTGVAIIATKEVMKF